MVLDEEEEGEVVAVEGFVGDCRPLENHRTDFDVVDVVDRSRVVVVVAAVAVAVAAVAVAVVAVAVDAAYIVEIGPILALDS